MQNPSFVDLIFRGVSAALFQFVEEATRAAMNHPDVEDWAKRYISKWVKSLGIQNLPERAGDDANVFLEKHVQELPQRWPQLFHAVKNKVYKIFPAPVIGA